MCTTSQGIGLSRATSQQWSSSRHISWWALAKIAAGLVLAVVLILGAFVAWRLYDRDPEIRAADVAPTPELIERVFNVPDVPEFPFESVQDVRPGPPGASLHENIVGTD